MLNFRKLIREDIPTLCEIRNSCVDYLHDSNVFSVEESLNWFDKTKPNFYSILVESNMVGYFRTSNYSRLNRSIYIGADLHPNFWGQGIGYKSYSQFLPYLFETYNLNKISLEVLSTNNRAIKLYNKLGFNTDGVKRQEVYKNEKFVDSILMSILKNEYYK